MKFFIDEAGVFVIPKNKKWAISCVGALCLPEQFLDSIFDGFEKLKKKWKKKGEVKGRKLNELEISELIDFLSQYNIMFEVSAIDMKMHSEKSLTKHRLIQAEKITENITREHQEPLIQALLKMQDEFKNLSNQLYCQEVCTFELLYNIVQKATLYYSQRLPVELSNFSWEIDAKNEKITPYEELWSKFLMPALQSKSFRNPFIQLKDKSADYRYFDKFCDVASSPPRHLKDAIGEVDPFYFININKIYGKNISFQQSHENTGIQLADILTTTVRRAMNGNLNKIGSTSCRERV